MSETRIGLTLKIDGQGRTSVTWDDGFGSFPEYRLVTDWLKEKIDKTRTALEALTNAYPQHIADDDPVLTNLAQHGHELRNALFEDFDSDDSAKANEARDWFYGLPKDGLTVTVNTDARLAIPWGALHEFGDRAPNSECYGGFWAPRFHVVASYSGVRILPRVKALGSAKLLAGKNEQMFAQTLGLLQSEQQQRIEQQLKRPIGCANTVKGCRKMWSNVGDHDCIIYFFGHATNKELLFSDLADGSLSVSEFQSLFRRDSQTERSRTISLKVLTILNGCLSGTGQDADSFLLATTRPGFYGFIGTEARIPNTFGLLFGHDLLEALLDHGITVGDAIISLRDRHKPYGLLYGCYAHPRLTAAAHAT